MNDADLVPAPETVQVCTVCALPWEAHERLAKSYDEEIDEYVPEPVGLEQCVYLLLRRFQGPPGPVGATGAMGMVDWDSKRVRGDIESIVREYLTRRSLS